MRLDITVSQEAQIINQISNSRKQTSSAQQEADRDFEDGILLFAIVTNEWMNECLNVWMSTTTNYQKWKQTSQSFESSSRILSSIEQIFSRRVLVTFITFETWYFTSASQSSELIKNLIKTLLRCFLKSSIVFCSPKLTVYTLKHQLSWMVPSSNACWNFPS